MSKRCEVCQSGRRKLPCRRCPLERLERRGGPSPSVRGSGLSALYLDQHLRLEGELGRGAMGTVYFGVDEDLDRPVAIKLLHPELQDTPELAARFRDVARATAAITHENVLSVYSCGRQGERDYFVAEYIDGFTLEQLLRASAGPLPRGCVLWILDEACAGLDAIHRRGVVHRDIKPGNLMLEAHTGRVVLMDFGVGPRPDATTDYSAPELLDARAFEGSDEHLADIFSLGVTAFEALTGRLPGRGERGEALPEGLREILLRCLSSNPRARYSSCAELREALGAIGQELPSDSALRGTEAVLGILDHIERKRAVELLDMVIVASTDPEEVVLVHQAVHRLRPKGSVEATRSASRALELARRLSAKVLVFSLGWGALDGGELVRMIRQDQALSAARIILLSPGLDPKRVQALEESGGAVVLGEVLTADVVEEGLWRALLEG